MTHAGADLGIDLPRLLDLARLTPAQAVLIAADALAASPGGPPAPADVLVGADGRVRLRASAGTGTAPAGALLDALAAAARQGPPPSGPAAELLAVLDRVARAAPGSDAGAVAEPLRALAAAAGPAPRSELARLVAAATGRAQPDGAAPATPGRPAPTQPRTRSGNDPRPGTGRRRVDSRAVMRRAWPWVASVTALAVVLATELGFLRDDVTRYVEALLAAGRGITTPTPAAEPPPLAPVAPSAAGGVLGVDLRTVRPCTAGAPCELRVHVRVSPTPAEQTVAWDYRVVDRCTGASSTVSGDSALVAPGGDRVDVVATVAVPRGEALAVVAVTREPAVAASAPLPVPAKGACGEQPGTGAG